MAKADMVEVPPLELTVQGDIGGGLVVALVERLPTNALSSYLDDRLDTMTRAWNRQKALINLRYLQNELEKMDLIVDRRDHKIMQVRKENADELVRMRASWQAAHDASTKRGDFKLGPQHQRALDDHEAKLKRMLEKVDEDVAEAKLQKPFIEKQIEKVRAQIAGDDPVYDDVAEAAE